MLHNINYKDVGVEMNKNRKEIEIIDIENTYIFAKSEIEKRIETVNFQKKEMKKITNHIFTKNNFGFCYNNDNIINLLHKQIFKKCHIKTYIKSVCFFI